MLRPVLRKRPIASLVAALLFVGVCVIAVAALEAMEKQAYLASAEDLMVSE